MHARVRTRNSNTLLMRGIKLRADTEGIPEQGGKIGAIDEACDC